jgi:hypothetical protein
MFVYVVNDTWAYWGIPLNLALAVVTLAFAGLIALVLLPRSAADTFSGRTRDWEDE